jgi:hypothetical protein
MRFIEIKDVLINADNVLAVKKDETFCSERSNIPKVYKLIIDMLDNNFYDFDFAYEKERDKIYRCLRGKK